VKWRIHWLGKSKDGYMVISWQTAETKREAVQLLESQVESKTAITRIGHTYIAKMRDTG